MVLLYPAFGFWVTTHEIGKEYPFCNMIAGLPRSLGHQHLRAFPVES